MGPGRTSWAWYFHSPRKTDQTAHLAKLSLPWANMPTCTVWGTPANIIFFFQITWGFLILHKTFSGEPMILNQVHLSECQFNPELNQNSYKITF